MKKLLFIALMAMFVGCAPTPEKMARALIKDYIEKNLDDPSTYEAVEFGELDSIIYPWSKYAAVLQERIDDLNNRIEGCHKRIKLYKSYHYIDVSSHIKDEEDHISLWNDEINQVKADLAKQDEWRDHKGFEIQHSFRATNAFGAKILNKYIFTISPDLTTIEDVEIIEE